MANQKIKILSSLILILVIVALNQESVRVEWTPGDNLVEWFEVRTRWRDKSEAVYFSSFRVNMPTHDTIVPRPRSGNFAVEVRACREGVSTPQCSTWLKSDIKGTPEPWIIFWKPHTPSIFVITEEEEFNGLR